MEEKERSRALSLRKKKSVRPKISAPKQIKEHPSEGNAERPRIDGTRSKQASRPSQENTSDLVKRRYSTRFTQLPVDINGGSQQVPAVPSIPGQYLAAQSEQKRPSGEEPKVPVDLKALTDSNLRPEQYVAELLANASEQQIQDFQQDLRNVKNRTSTDLQHNVYQNRAEFIKISKQADKLKSELRTLRSLMSELTGSLDQSSVSDGPSNDTTTARKRANRSSVANLEALWGTQLQSIWKEVEGSQKYLPAIPGRHVVWQSSHWVELNAATLKPRRRAHVFLFNDHLMVASEKKRLESSTHGPKEDSDKAGQTRIQLVAEKCWPVQDIDITDLASQPMLKDMSNSGTKSYAANAVSIHVGTEHFAFATRSAYGPEKGILLGHFRRTAEELRKGLYAETDRRERPRDSIGYGAWRDSTSLKPSETTNGLSHSATQSKTTATIDVDGKQQSIRWVENQIDDLEIQIALQRFDEAVKNVEKLRKIIKGIKGSHEAREIVLSRSNEQARKLAEILRKELVQSSSGMTSTRKHVGWLIRLGFDDTARDTYLEARSKTIRSRARQCMFEGDLQQYTYQISYIYFVLIKNTISVYQSCFPPTMMSACVKWAKEHVDDFNLILARQLSSVDKDSEVFRGCMQRAQQHAALLNEVGMDFKSLVGRTA